MQEKIFAHLREKYEPDVIILHGSRARGKARDDSDWDFIFLYNENRTDLPKGRELYNDQNIEYHSLTIPLEEISQNVVAKLNSALVVFDTNDEGKKFLARSNETRQKGVQWSDTEIEGHRLWFMGRINGMRDNTNNPLLFYRYFSDLYQRIFNYWYWITQKRYSEPTYDAIPEIQETDPAYLKLIDELIAEPDLSKKVTLAMKIHDHIFNK